MTGQLDILSCGEGDIKIVFDQNNPLEVERAKRIITDCLKRGYALFVHGTDNALIRVKKFIEGTAEYIIADGPAVPPESEPVEEETKGRAKSAKARWAKVKASKVKATVVGRSAGG